MVGTEKVPAEVDHIVTGEQPHLNGVLDVWEVLLDNRLSSTGNGMNSEGRSVCCIVAHLQTPGSAWSPSCFHVVFLHHDGKVVPQSKRFERYCGPAIHSWAD